MVPCGSVVRDTGGVQTCMETAEKASVRTVRVRNGETEFLFVHGTHANASVIQHSLFSGFGFIELPDGYTAEWDVESQ